MFFVGATGQLLTLTLTVVLPFVFLLSGNRNIELASQTFTVTAHSAHSEVVMGDVECSGIHQSAISEAGKAPVVFLDCCAQNFLSQGFTEKWKTIYSKSSGNKAPPGIPGFIC